VALRISPWAFGTAPSNRASRRFSIVPMLQRR
jgi:hypothetical protein